MEIQLFDNVVKFEKGKAIASFNRFHRIGKAWQFFEVMVALWLISWSSSCVPAVLKVIVAYFAEFYAQLFNHHVVFLVGNAIVVVLFVLCRRNEVVSFSGSGDLYDDYVKYSVAAHHRESNLPVPPAGAECLPTDERGRSSDEEKQIVVCMEEREASSECDGVATAIEEATRQIRRFQRTQSEKLKRELAGRQQHELRRSETDWCSSRTVSSANQTASEIETLSSDEFRRRVDEFIDKHWRKRRANRNQLEYTSIMDI